MNFLWGVPLERKHTDVMKVRKSQRWSSGGSRDGSVGKRRRNSAEQIPEPVVSGEHTCERCGANRGTENF